MEGIIGQPTVDAATEISGNHIIDMLVYISSLLNQSGDFPRCVQENVPDLGE
jgi:hypothetical protein